jgi:hypothetical protein
MVARKQNGRARVPISHERVQPQLPNFIPLAPISSFHHFPTVLSTCNKTFNTLPLGDIQTSLAEEETSKINPCIYSQPKC